VTYEFWIGAKNEGHGWYWEKSKLELQNSDIPWGKGEPSGEHGGYLEQCLSLTKHDDTNFHYNDVRCQSSNAVVCETAGCENGEHRCESRKTLVQNTSENPEERIVTGTDSMPVVAGCENGEHQCESKKTLEENTSENPDDQRVTGSNSKFIIASIIPILIIFIIMGVMFVCHKERKNKAEQDQAMQLPGPGMGNRHDSENSLYGVVMQH
ncbi:unnamed protein product, partial [Meganyctiphanes norvegica]